MNDKENDKDENIETDEDLENNEVEERGLQLRGKRRTNVNMTSEQQTLFSCCQAISSSDIPVSTLKAPKEYLIQARIKFTI